MYNWKTVGQSCSSPHNMLACTSPRFPKSPQQRDEYKVSTTQSHNSNVYWTFQIIFLDTEMYEHIKKIITKLEKIEFVC